MYRRGINRTYNVFYDGDIVGRERGTSALVALRMFARRKSLQYGEYAKLGDCGELHIECRKCSRVYSCGKDKKCDGITCLETSEGMIYTNNK